MSARLVSRIATFAVTAFASVALAQAPDKPAAPPKPSEAAKPEAGKAAPATAAPMAAAKPPAELDALKPWAQNWKCDVETTMPGAPAPMKGKATISTKWEMGKNWVTYVHRVAKTKEMPGVEGHGMVGYDSAKKEYMFFGVDSMGGYIDLTAPAVSATEVKWTGNGNMMGKMMPLEFTWTMQNNQYDIKLASGGQVIQHHVCKK